MRRNRKSGGVVAVDTASDDALVTIPVVTGIEVDTGSRTLPSGSALKARYAPLALGYAAAARHSAAESVAPRVEAAREAVAPRVEAAREAVAPKVEAAREAVAPKVEAAREAAMDRAGGARELLEENLPRLAKMVASALAASAAATEEAKHRSADAALVLKGDATIKRRRSGVVGGGWLRGLLAALGVIAVAGAVAAYLTKRANEQEDPWARPLADPYVAPQSGREPTVTQSAPYAAGAPAATVSEDFEPTPDVAPNSASPAPLANTGELPVMDPTQTPAVEAKDVGVVNLTNDGMPHPDGSADASSSAPREADDGPRN